MKRFYASFITAFIFLTLPGKAQLFSVRDHNAPAFAESNTVLPASQIAPEIPNYHQFNFEGGISLNSMNCLTDLGGGKGIGKKFVKDLNFGYSQISAGIFGDITYKNTFSLRIEATAGKVAAADRVLNDVKGIAIERFNRNQNFHSKISEIAVMLEIHPLYFFNQRFAGEDAPLKFSPYILGGVGDFSFNPKTNYNGREITLQPLHTEGEGFAEHPDRKNYKLNQVNIPLGVGVKYQYSPLVIFRAEFIYRKIFTDYLDDVSTTYIDPALFDKYLSPDKAADAKAVSDRQIIVKVGNDGKRGSPEFNDGYFSFNLKASINIGRNRN